MRLFSRGTTALLVVFATMFSITLPALAQPSPEAGGCTLEPLTVPLWDATPAADVAATPVANPNLDVSDADITAAIETILACINTGEPQLMFAIFTDRYLAEMYANPESSYLPAFELRIAENVLEPSGQFTLEAVSDIARLDDGRIEVVAGISNGSTVVEDTLVLALQGDDWLIDGVTTAGRTR